MQSTPHHVPPGQIEIWFEFGSPYSYLSVMRIEELAAARGVHVAWRPFLLGPIFKALGWQSSPFLEQKEKMLYMWRDMERLAEKYAVPFVRPSLFPRVALLPMRVALYAQDEAWIGEFCRAVMLQHFGEDLDINEPRNVESILLALGLQAGDILGSAQADPVKAALRQQTERARELGIFGGPTFFAAGEMYWGNDRLEDALEQAAA